MPVLYWMNEPDSEALGLDERHVHLVMEYGARIAHRAQFSDNTFRPVIDRLLAP
jgi:hypothetical protein